MRFLFFSIFLYFSNYALVLGIFVFLDSENYYSLVTWQRKGQAALPYKSGSTKLPGVIDCYIVRLSVMQKRTTKVI